MLECVCDFSNFQIRHCEFHNLPINLGENQHASFIYRFVCVLMPIHWENEMRGCQFLIL